MYALHKLRADELDRLFLDTLNHQFYGREIEIAVSEVDSTEDETAYLLRSPANRERLLRAIDDVANGRDLDVVDLDEIP